MPETIQEPIRSPFGGDAYEKYLLITTVAQRQALIKTVVGIAAAAGVSQVDGVPVEEHFDRGYRTQFDELVAEHNRLFPQQADRLNKLIGGLERSQNAEVTS